MKKTGDIDLDFADRNKVLKCIDHTVASRISDNQLLKHNTGIYVTEIPKDPISGLCSIDYKQAEERGYFKLDLLNVHLYSQVTSMEHLIELMKEPDWSMLDNKSIVEKVIHINNQWHNLLKMPEKINSIPRMAMFLSIIRPGKKHLIGKKWSDVSKEVWLPNADGKYVFRKSHAIAYAHLVVVNLNLLRHSTDQCD